MSMLVNSRRFVAMGGGGAGTHRYWRLKIDTVGDMSRQCVCSEEVEFLLADTTDATSLGGTAIGSSQDFGAYGNAFDNNNTTIWHSGCGTAASQWIGWDFGSGNGRDIAGVSWRSRNDGTLGNSDSIVTGGLEYSDDAVTWTRLFSIMPQYTWTADQKRVLPRMPAPFIEAGGHRYWRLLMTSHSISFFDGLSRFQLYYGSSQDISVMGTNAAASSIQGGSADQIFKTNSDTAGLLQYNTSTSIQWVSKDFGAGYAPAITSIRVAPNRDDPARTWMGFDLQYSDDNAAWTTLSSFTPVTWVAATPQTFIV